LTVATQPAARWGAVAAAVSGRVVLFGGEDSGGAYANDAWDWNGSIWTQEHPATSPPPRVAPSLAAVDGKLVLFGGAMIDHSMGPTALGDTWAWSGGNWTVQRPARSPLHRSAAAMAALGGRVMMFGGDDGTG